jgi:hypothetical protein
MPLLAASWLKISSLAEGLRKYCMDRNTDTPKMTIMANHMGTWKYRLRMLSFTMARRGTGSRKPATAV